MVTSALHLFLIGIIFFAIFYPTFQRNLQNIRQSVTIRNGFFTSFSQRKRLFNIFFSMETSFLHLFLKGINIFDVFHSTFERSLLGQLSCNWCVSWPRQDTTSALRKNRRQMSEVGLGQFDKKNSTKKKHPGDGNLHPGAGKQVTINGIFCKAWLQCFSRN